MLKNKSTKRSNFPSYFLMLLGFLSASFLFTQCDPNDFTTDPSDALLFSTDTLSFDTIFVDVGSVTDGFLVYNLSSQKINISDIQLARGNDSPFRINVAGTPVDKGAGIQDVEVWSEDSIYVFVEVTVDPNDAATPFVVEDSIFFETNGNLQQVKLVAWGQNANFWGPGTPNGFEVCDEVWTNEKPYIIYDGLIVDSLCTLTIQAGTQVHIHNGASIFVEGTLRVEGGKDTTDWVIFQGTRLELGYEDVPGQWQGLHFLGSSSDNSIEGTIIQNASVGIRSELPPSNFSPKLTMECVTIRNMVDIGILGINTVIAGNNCLVYNCGRFNVAMIGGGVYAFTQSTFTNFSGIYIDHRNPIIAANDFVVVSETQIDVADLDAQFYNCIIYGGEDEEIDTADISGAGNINFQFVNCLLKTEWDTTSAFFTDCIFNPASQDTLFTSIFENDFRLNNSSPAVNSGIEGSEIPINLFDLTRDLLGNSRDSQPDMGAYELIE